jgi:hypothetical protein
VTMVRVLPRGIPDDLESLLAAAYTAEMPADLGAMIDNRVRRAVHHWRPQASGRSRLAPPRRWRLTSIPILAAFLAAAALLTTSASGGPAAVYNSYGGYAWQHAEVLGLTKTVDGYRITLERAYADANQMMLAITVMDTQNRGWSQVDIGSLSVADSAGGDWTEVTGIGDPVTITSAATISWFEYGPAGPAALGRRPFAVTVSSVSVRDQEDGPSANDPSWVPWRLVAVNATFSFDLTVGGSPTTVGGGSSATVGGVPRPTVLVGGCSPSVVGASPQATEGGSPPATGGAPQATVGGGSPAMPHVWSESNGVTLTLESIVSAPSQVRLDLRMAGAPAGGINWTPIVDCVSHNGHNLDVAMQTSNLGSQLTTAYTAVGVEDPTGDWTVWVSQLMGDGTGADNQGKDVRYDGNWTLHFSMPKG